MINSLQFAILAFGLVCISVSLTGVWAVRHAQHLRFKPLWYLASLFGFIGIGLNWTQPEDLVLLFGINGPVVNVYSPNGSGVWLVKVLFPVGAAFALWRARQPLSPPDP